MKLAEAATPKDVKVAISIRLDSDIYMAAKERSREFKIPYQTLINNVLRRAFLDFSGVVSSGSVVTGTLSEREIRKIAQEEILKSAKSKKKNAS